jgi:hypothetical protein
LTTQEATMRGTGRATFAAILLLIVGTLNIVYGIGALDGANIFVNEKRFILDDLNRMGWVLIILGAIQLTGGFSLFAGNTYGRVIGITPVLDRRRQPVVVAGHLLPVCLGRLRDRRSRRRRGRATSLSVTHGLRT